MFLIHLPLIHSLSGIFCSVNVSLAALRVRCFYRLKQCRKKGWAKYGYGALDLSHLPSSDKVLNRTNVSGTSPKFEYCEC